MIHVFTSVFAMQERDHLVFPFFTWVGINIMAFNYIRVTLVAIMEAGRQPALEIIVL